MDSRIDRYRLQFRKKRDFGEVRIKLQRLSRFLKGVKFLLCVKYWAVAERAIFEKYKSQLMFLSNL